MVIGITLGILVGGIGVGAVTCFSASQVSYTPSNETWNVTNVQDTITDLYNKTSNNDGNLSYIPLAENYVLGYGSSTSDAKTFSLTFTNEQLNESDFKGLKIQTSYGGVALFLIVDGIEEYHTTPTLVSNRLGVDSYEISGDTVTISGWYGYNASTTNYIISVYAIV